MGKESAFALDCSLPFFFWPVTVKNRRADSRSQAVTHNQPSRLTIQGWSSLNMIELGFIRDLENKTSALFSSTVSATVYTYNTRM